MKVVISFVSNCKEREYPETLTFQIKMGGFANVCFILVKDICISPTIDIFTSIYITSIYILPTKYEPIFHSSLLNYYFFLEHVSFSSLAVQSPLPHSPCLCHKHWILRAIIQIPVSYFYDKTVWPDMRAGRTGPVNYYCDIKHVPTNFWSFSIPHVWGFSWPDLIAIPVTR